MNDPSTPHSGHQDLPRGIDLADLVSMLVSAKSPSRTLDTAVEAMLGGPEPRRFLPPSAVLASRWLADETPEYTTGGKATSVLASRRGYRVQCDPEGALFRARALNPSTGERKEAVGHTEGCAAAAAVAWLAVSEAPR